MCVRVAPVKNEECRVTLQGGGAIICDVFPHDVSFIRVDGPNGEELGYWTIDEIQEDPAEVLGAILGAAAGAVRERP